MNNIVKSTARGERVVSIKQPSSQKASVSAIDVKSMSIRVKGPILKVKLNTTGCDAELQSRNGNVMTWSQIMRVQPAPQAREGVAGNTDGPVYCTDRASRDLGEDEPVHRTSVGTQKSVALNGPVPSGRRSGPCWCGCCCPGGKDPIRTI